MIQIPIQSPRHTALLGRVYPIPPAEFERLWREKFPEGQPSEPPLTKAEAEQAFLAHVKFIQDQGKTFNDSWNQGMITEPGKSAYKEWRRLADLEKENRQKSSAPIAAATAAVSARQRAFTNLLNEREQQAPSEDYEDRFRFVCNSDAGQELLDQMHRPEEPIERHDPKVLADAKQGFNDIVERLALEDDWRGSSDLARRAYAMEKHPEGKKLYKLWKDQELLKQKEELAQRQKARSPHL